MSLSSDYFSKTAGAWLRSLNYKLLVQSLPASGNFEWHANIKMLRKFKLFINDKHLLD